MKLKFLVSSLLVGTMLFATGCGASVDKDLETYKKAVESVDNLTNATLKSDLTITIKAEDQDVSSNTLTTFKKVKNAEDDYDAEINVATNILDTETVNKAYYTDGVLYVDMNGNKVKQTTTFDNAESLTNISFPDFDKSYIEEIKVSEVPEEESNKNIEFVFSPEGMTKVMKENLGDYQSALGAADESINVSKASFITTVNKDGDFVCSSLYIEADMNTEDGNVPFVYSNNTEVMDKDNTTVSLPDDLDTYVDANELSQSQQQTVEETTSAE